MNQQIKLYQPQFRPQTRMFPAWFMFQAAAIVLFGMVLMYMFAQQRIDSVEQELTLVARHETIVLERLQNLEPRIVVPWRGPAGGADILADQLERLTGLVAHVEDELLAGRSASEISDGMSASWFIDWHRNEPETAGAALEAVIDRVAGLQPPWELMEERGLREGPSPTHDDEGWKRPTKVLWRNYWPDRLPLLEQVAPGVEIVPFDDSSEALGEVADADAIIGTCLLYTSDAADD